jgi:Ca2+/Na+ antiporter
MSSFRPFVHPFEGLRNGEVTYTTAIVTPVIKHENRKKIEEKAQIMGYAMLLFIGAFIAALFKLKLLYTILFWMFLFCLFTYLIVAAIMHKN